MSEDAANDWLTGKPVKLGGPTAATPDPSQCRFCRWWKDPYSSIETRPDYIPPEYAQGECHRRSPKSVKKPGYGHRESVWPPITGADWCGDFERFRNADGTPNTASHPPGA